MDNKRLVKDGSFTIELTLLFPIIMAIMLLIIYSNYYVHDRAIIEKTCYVSALRGALCTDEAGKTVAALEAFNKEIEGKLLGKWEYSIDADRISEEVIVQFEGFMYQRQGLLIKIIKGKLFEFKTEVKSDTANETEYLRRATKANQ